MIRVAASLALTVTLAVPVAAQNGPPAGTEIEFSDLDQVIVEVQILKMDGEWSDDVTIPPGTPLPATRILTIPDDGPCVRNLAVSSAEGGAWTQEFDFCVQNKFLGVSNDRKSLVWCEYPLCDGQ